MSKTVFITGTDTGVGKTVVSGIIAKILKESGCKVGYFKPVETGCSPDCLDAQILSQITGQDLEEVVLYRFKNPVAPLVAEKLENKKIEMAKIYSHLDKLKERYDYIIVEGAGGIKVPITEENGNFITYLDFIYETSIPVVVVSRAGLGTINHTVLTVDVLSSIGAEIKGIVINGYTGKTISEKTNPEVIYEMTGVPIISVINKMDIPIENMYQLYSNMVSSIF